MHRNASQCYAILRKIRESGPVRQVPLPQPKARTPRRSTRNGPGKIQLISLWKLNLRENGFGCPKNVIGSDKRFRKVFAAGSCTVSLLFAALWYSANSALRDTGQQINATMATKGSMIVFIFTVLAAGCCKWLAKG
jgi:hypothetical protein